MATSLEPYIRKATRAQDTTKIFNSIPGEMLPMLSLARTNRILVYNGCFNPPHQGHLALLSQAFHNCGEDLNVVAAVVIMASDRYIKYKLKHEHPHGGRKPLVLPLARRIRLWDAELEAKGISWCFAYPEDRWAGASTALRRDLKRDGFEVDFVRVAGGDKIGRHFHTHGTWNCRTMITSDICRPVDFYEDSAPENLVGHGPWKAVDVDDEALRERAWMKAIYSTPSGTDDLDAMDEDQKATFLADVIENAYVQSVAAAKKRKLWACEVHEYTSSPRGYAARFIASEDHLDPDISSEKIRGIIAKSSPDRLEAELQGIALSPALLAQFILEQGTG